MMEIIERAISAAFLPVGAGLLAGLLYVMYLATADIAALAPSAPDNAVQWSRRDTLLRYSAYAQGCRDHSDGSTCGSDAAAYATGVRR